MAIYKVRSAIQIVGLTCGALASAPAHADDAKTGFFAGLGFSAADGKTSLGSGAGTIEASLLVSDAFLLAGAEVRRLVVAAASNKGRGTVLLLGHSDTIDFTMARSIAERLDALYQARPTDTCIKPPVQVETKTVTTKKTGKMKFLDGWADVAGGATQTTTETKKGIQATDVAPALATSISVSGITLTADDRMLINAVQIGASKPVWQPLNTVDASKPPPVGKVAYAGVTFILPGQIIDFDDDPQSNVPNSVMVAYKQLKDWSDTHRFCDTATYKAALNTIDTYEKSIVAGDKGAPPLAVAAELAPLAKLKPLTLRLAVEQVGGSAVSRSNIWYAAGFPGAATVSAGLLISFRLSDPILGHDYLTGFIRCTVPPTGLREVNGRLDPKNDTNGNKATKRITCGVIAG